MKFIVFFFNDTATTEIYTLSLHDALPICLTETSPAACINPPDEPFNGSIGLPISSTEIAIKDDAGNDLALGQPRSEEHTSELQSRLHLVCRLLLEKKKKQHSR